MRGLIMTTLKDYRFMLSPDGQTCDWFHPAEIAKRCHDWTDCTNMSDELFQRPVVERQGMRPYVLGVAA